MRLLSYSVRLAPALIVACVLSACGGGSDGGGGFFGGLPGAGTPPTNPPVTPDTGVKPEMRCAP